MKFILFAFFLTALSIAQAEDAPACRDLAKASCTKAEANDGTGVSSPRKRPGSADLNRIEKEVRTEVRQHLQNALSALSREERVAMLQMFDKSAVKECSLRKIDSPECRDQIVASIAKMIESHVLPSVDIGTGRTVPLNPRNFGLTGDLKSISQFQTQPFYTSALSKFSESLQHRIADPSLNRKVSEKMLPELKELTLKKIEQYVTDEE